MSSTGGTTRVGCVSAWITPCDCVNGMRTSFASCAGSEDDACDQPQQAEHLDQPGTDDHVPEELAGDFRLTGGGRLGLADHDTQTHTGAEGGKTVTDGGDVAGDVAIHCVSFLWHPRWAPWGRAEVSLMHSGGAAHLRRIRQCYSSTAKLR